jgi:diguanylate cyclase (GGDEF)-like protein
VDLGTLFPLAGGERAEAIETNKAIYVPDLSRDARGIAYLTPAGRRGSILVVPVTYQDRRLGTMNFSSSIVDAFTPGQRELMITAGHQAALALANAQLFRQTLELARTDGLTGIANRRSLEERLEMEWAARERYQGSLSVLMIDIDHFKHYNDNQGHQLGDEALRRVAQALAGSVRKVDGVGRYGGEEFLVLLPRTDKEQAIQVAEKLRRVIEAMRFERDTDQPLGRITVSAGVASAPLDADTLATLVARADAALFAAKNGGRNRVVPYRAQS